MMSLGSSLVGNIGNNLFATMDIDLGILLGLHGVTINVSRYDQTADTDRDIYAEPTGSPSQFNAIVLIGRQELKEDETMAGGKIKEFLSLIGQPGTLQENDIATYNGHNYAVQKVGKPTVQSAIAAEIYWAVREVDV